MANLYITSESPYARNLNKIRVTGRATPGATVKVMIISRPAQQIVTQSDFLAKYNSVATHASAMVPTPVAVPGGTDGGGVGVGMSALTDWTVDVPVTGLTAGTEYVIYASDGAGKIVLQDPATFN